MKTKAEKAVRARGDTRLTDSLNQVLADAEVARDLSGEANATESQDLTIGRMAVHQETVWMLKSFLKG